MKFHPLALMLGASLALAACWTQGDDTSAEKVEQTAENVAAELDAEAANAAGGQAERLEDTADVVRDTGEEAADSVDDHDIVLNNAQTH